MLSPKPYFFKLLLKQNTHAQVIVGACSLVDWHEPLFLWSSSKKEFCVLVTTFCITAFVDIDIGIYVSIALSAAEVLYKSTQPKVAVLSDNLIVVFLPGSASGGVLKEKDMLPEHLVGHDILVLRVEGDMTFSAASTLRRILSTQFKERLGKSDINSLVFDFTVPFFFFNFVDAVEGETWQERYQFARL